MRVIIKPAGFAVLVGALAFLGGTLVFMRDSASPKETSEAHAATPNAAALLQNTGFERSPDHSGYLPSATETKARISGVIAKGWRDDSGWTESRVKYALDSARPHGGTRSQRIAVEGLKSGQVQFAQEVRVPKGKTCRAALWLRASAENVPVELSLRQVPEPYANYGSRSAAVGREWTRVEVSAEITRETPTYVMLAVRKSGVTVWADDAELELRP